MENIHAGRQQLLLRVVFSWFLTVTLCNIYHCSAHKLYVKKLKFSSAILKHAIYSKMLNMKFENGIKLITIQEIIDL